MKNKLTLKSLQQELDNMKLKTGKKVSKSTKPAPIENVSKGGIGHDIKNSYINSLYMRSSGLMLYLITGLLGYAYKIPFIGKLVGLGAAYYGKTTIWKLLSTLRKVFIVINAIIGVYMVFKTAGFSFDNVLIGWTAIGETYLQTLLSLSGKLFRWFVELFDHKVVPNVPGDSGGTWFNKPSTPQHVEHNYKPYIFSKAPDVADKDFFSLRALYKDTVIRESKSWYKDSTTWMWIIGTVCTAGAIYLGYKIIADPSYILTMFKSNPSINTQGPTPPLDPSSSNLPPISPDITLSDRISNSASDFSKSVVNVYKATVSRLNPFNYFVTSAEMQDKFSLFMDVQNDMNRANRNFYPFTENNPFDSMLKRIRIQYFGENADEFFTRTRDRMYAERIYEALKVSKGKAVDLAGGTPLFSAPTTPGYITPAAAIGLHPSTSALVDSVNAAIVDSKLSTISPTPSIAPTVEWASHTVDKTEEGYKHLDLWKRWRRSSSSDKPFNIFKTNVEVIEAVDSIETHDNKFSGLPEEFI